MPRYLKYKTSLGESLKDVPDELLETIEVGSVVLLAVHPLSPINQFTNDPYMKGVACGLLYVFYDMYIIGAKASPCTCKD